MYSPEERQIFRYHNGTKMVCADPAVLYRRFLKAIGGEQRLGDIEKKLASANDQLVEQGIEELLPAVREGLNLKSLDEEGQGATEAEQLRAYYGFLEFLTESKKKVENSPTWQPSMEEASSGPPVPTSQSGSPSGSIAAGSSVNKQF